MIANAIDAAVHVVIPTRDNLDELAICLASLERQERRPDRVLVCVDGSTDGTFEHLESILDSYSITLVILAHPGRIGRGRAAARNLATASLASGYAWFVDSDMDLAPDALHHHLQTVQGGGIVSVGSVVYANRAETEWASYLSTRGRNRYPDGADLPFTQFTTANALVPAEDVVALGGFDERFSGYGGEDLEFAYRLRAVRGLRFVHARAAIASTVEDKTKEDALSQFESYGATNLHLMESLHPEMPRTFELHRLDSMRPRDRLFKALLSPRVQRLISAVAKWAPRSIRIRLFNYEVIASVWRGYRQPRSSS